MGYELLENDLTDSTLWMYRSDAARILAITIISKCHGSDRVSTPPAVLIERARLSPEVGAAALEELSRPDPNSRCRLEDGRFIVAKIDEDGNGYLWLPSYAGRRKKYLARERQRLKRERDTEASRSVTQSHTPSPDVTNGHDVTLGHTASRFVAPDQIRSEPDQNQKQKERARFAPPSVQEVQEHAGPGFDAPAFVAFYESKGWKVGNQPMKSWHAAITTWKQRRAAPEPPRLHVHVNQADLDEADEIKRNRTAASRVRAERDLRDIGSGGYDDEEPPL